MSPKDGSSPSTENAPDRALAGARHVDLPKMQMDTDFLDRRTAVADLGQALRELVANAIGSEVTTEVLRSVAAEARELASRLAERQRRLDEPSSVDDVHRGQRPFNPVVGAGNPVAPPMHVEIIDGVAVGTCTLDWRYEGPFTYAHGGVSALLLDTAMGYAAAAAGHPGVTARLEVRYRSTVPLGEPLLVRAELIDVLGVRAAIRGSISLEETPDDVLVEAEGRFLALRPEQAARLFGSRADGVD